MSTSKPCPPGTTVCIVYPDARPPSAVDLALGWVLVAAGVLATVVLMLAAISLAIAIRRGVREQRADAATAQAPQT